MNSYPIFIYTFCSKLPLPPSICLFSPILFDGSLAFHWSIATNRPFTTPVSCCAVIPFLTPQCALLPEYVDGPGTMRVKVWVGETGSCFWATLINNSTQDLFRLTHAIMALLWIRNMLRWFPQEVCAHCCTKPHAGKILCLVKGAPWWLETISRLFVVNKTCT